MGEGESSTARTESERVLRWQDPRSRCGQGCRRKVRGQVSHMRKRDLIFGERKVITIGMITCSKHATHRGPGLGSRPQGLGEGEA